MTAIEMLLGGLIDYAGLYPPAGLDMRTAVRNYRKYRGGKHAAALGRLILNIERLHEFRSIAGDSVADFPLSVIAAENLDGALLAEHIGSGLRIESVEIKCSQPAEIERLARQIPDNVMAYIEVPFEVRGLSALASICAAGASAKIRMGGVVPDAIPSISNVAQMLKMLADLRLSFKATAGLHHPLRLKRALTYDAESPTGVMHGFVNLSCAATHLFFGGDIEEAKLLLAEEDPNAWQVDADSLRWRDQTWTADQLAMVRQEFFRGIGSCSFEEPIQDLESLGWL